MALAPGASVGPFRLESLLGRGGMGAVWRAVDGRTGAAVALKLLPPDPDAEARVRFGREARLAMALRHPHVVRTLDAGLAGDTPWVALELLPGTRAVRWRA